MNPILVNNNTEWLRLAPVLERKGYDIAHHDCVPTQHDPFKNEEHPIVVWITGRWVEYDWYGERNYPETQSVNEYLSTNAKSETV